MASLYKYRGMYYISYKMSGKRITKNTGLSFSPENRPSALAAKREIEEIEKRNKLQLKYGLIKPSPSTSKIKLSQAIEIYLNSIGNETKGKQDYHTRTFKVSVRQFLKTISLDVEISNITPDNIYDFIKKISNEISNASVLTYIRYLRGFFNFLVENEYLDKTPIKRRMIPKTEIRKIIIFEQDAIKKILEIAFKTNYEYFKIFKMLLLTGVRPNDLINLKVGDIDFHQKIIRLGISKTKRTIDFPMYEELKDFIVNNFPGIVDMQRDELIFKQYTVERIGKMFRRILIKLDLKGESYNLKTFRKTFASAFAEKGLAEGDLADLLGHTSTVTTRQYYKRKNASIIRDRIDNVGGLKIC